MSRLGLVGLGGAAAGALVLNRPLLRWGRGQLDARLPPDGQEAAFLGLGGNLGDRLDHLNRAVRALDAHPRIVVDEISSVYETEPLGPSDEDFLNICVRVLTDLSPLALLRACQHVEDAQGRERTVRWGARTIDVDVLLYGDRTIAHGDLVVPHPEMSVRPFVLVPLLEVAPGWVLPDGRRLSAAVAALAPIEGVRNIGRQVSVQPMPDGPPDIASLQPPPGSVEQPPGAGEG